MHNFAFDNVLLIPKFFSLEECQEEIAFAKQSGFLTQRYGSRGATYHDRRRAFVDDPKRARRIYEKLNIPPLEVFFDGMRTDPVVDDLPKWKSIGLNERLRYYQYEIGQLFSRHFDIL